MGDDFELEFSSSKAKPNSDAASRKKRVEIDAGVLEELEEYASRDLHNEQGAMLLGEWSVKDGHYLIRILAWIEAKYTEQQRSNITFTHKTWDYVHQQRETYYPDFKIIGWYHTHPGFGVFLSSYDRFIHENFFTEEWHVAVVTDPRSKATGGFAWIEGQVSPCSLDVVGTAPREDTVPTPVPASIPAAGAGPATAVSPGPRSSELERPVSGWRRGFGFAALGLVGLVFGLMLGLLLAPYYQGTSSLAVVLESTQPQQAAPPREPLQFPAFRPVGLGPGVVPIKTQPYTPPQEERPTEVYVWMPIVVEPGDTLDGLIRKTRSQQFRQLIIEHNGINDPNYIRVGMELEFPVINQDSVGGL